MRRWINKVLHLFGYHLARDPGKRKKRAKSIDTQIRELLEEGKETQNAKQTS